MSVVTRAGTWQLADPSTQLGAGRDALHSPMRGGLDYQSALGDTVEQAGNDIRGVIDGSLDDIVDEIRDLTGIDLSGPEALLKMLLALPLDALGNTPLGGLLVQLLAGTGQLQQVITMLGSLVGIGGGGDNPIAALVTLIGQGLQIPGMLFEQIFGQQAAGQAQINNLASGGFTHDFAGGVAGWTNLVGTLALSSRGNYVQTASQTVAYRASNVASDKFGLHFVVTPSMRGVCRAGICAASDGSTGVDLEVVRGFDGDALRLVTRGSPTLTVTQKQVDFTGPGRLSDLTSLDIRTDGVSAFWVLRNGQPVLDWPDTAGMVAHSPATRGVLLTSNGDDVDDDGYYGPAITGKLITYGTW